METAVTGMMRNFEIPELEAKGQKVTAFFPEENGIPNYSELIFISHLANTDGPIKKSTSENCHQNIQEISGKFQYFGH